MKSTNWKHSIFYLLILLIASCAKVSSPAGGPRDEDPPKVLKSVPLNESVNFNRRSFAISFDEYFVLDKVDQVLMISPPLEKKPVIKIRGKTMVVELDEDEQLKENTTYSFNFLNSIRDLNENNPLENFKYVFSTGDIIDSLSVTGSIYDAFNLEAGEDILVLLHSEMADTVPRTLLPQYITKAAVDGNFRIDNIAGDEYKIYGLKDNNNNKMYDQPSEAFAFLDSSIFVTPENNYIPGRPDSLLVETDSLLISSETSEEDSLALPERPAQRDSLLLQAIPLEEDPEVSTGELIQYDSLMYERIPGREYELFYFIAPGKQLYLSGRERSLPYLLQFTFSLPLDTASVNMQFADVEDEVHYIREISAGRDTFKIWLTDSAFYSRESVTVYLEYPATDTLGQISQFTDTINLRYRAPVQGRRPTGKALSGLTFKTNLSQPAGLRPEENPVFIFETPMRKADTSRIKLFMKSDTLMINRKFDLHRDSVNAKKFNIICRLVPDSSYLLTVDKGAFTDIYDHSNDSTSYNVRVRNPEQFGKLVMNISGYRGMLIVLLMDASEKIVREKKIKLDETKSLEFPYLDSKDYIVKLIFDIDGDGKWTSGDYDLKRQPEPVSYFPKKINVKAGWDMIEDWHIEGIRRKEEAISSTRGAKEKK
ncbi:MAG: Ig-like domain-containing protein [Bacteroidales bacterium]|nr:Ig-like domain-containing protein [Bacteroidales bacterium]